MASTRRRCTSCANARWFVQGFARRALPSGLSGIGSDTRSCGLSLRRLASQIERVDHARGLSLEPTWRPLERRVDRRAWLPGLRWLHSPLGPATARIIGRGGAAVSPNWHFAGRARSSIRCQFKCQSADPLLSPPVPNVSSCRVDLAGRDERQGLGSLTTSLHGCCRRAAFASPARHARSRPQARKKPRS